MSLFKAINFKSLGYVARLIGFPFVVVAILGWSFIPHFKSYAKEGIAFGLMTCICLGIVLLIKKKRFRKILVICFYILLAFLAFTKLSFYYNYDVKISPSALFVIFETNTSEASDFLDNYIDVYVIGLFLLFFLPLLFYRRFLKSKHLDFHLSSSIIKIVCVVLILSSAFVIHKKFSNENIMLMSLSSYGDYQQTKQNLKAQLAQQTNSALLSVSSIEDAKTHVVIIGEATSRWHMQLYGYNRETNPKLNEIQDELLVFDSVITPHVHTILALEKIFTLSNYHAPDIKNNASIVQLANQAGYDTYWISNQKPVGLHESIPTIIGSAAKHKQFLATDDYTYDIYDDAVLPSLHDALKSTSQKKIIFIHLIGAHAAYKHRYPKAFNYFSDTNVETKINHKKAIETINHYDNAIRYNDSIVRQIIEQVRAKKTNSYVVYFSDHGDEVYDTMDLEGHNEYHATRPMYEIPFILWMSDSYKAKHPELLKQDRLTKRRYNLEDFIHTFSNLSDIQFSTLDNTRSLVDSTYTMRPRYIKEGEDYDKR